MEQERQKCCGNCRYARPSFRFLYCGINEKDVMPDDGSDCWNYGDKDEKYELHDDGYGDYLYFP